jgi:hypothetical protein
MTRKPLRESLPSLGMPGGVLLNPPVVAGIGALRFGVLCAGLPAGPLILLDLIRYGNVETGAVRPDPRHRKSSAGSRGLPPSPARPSRGPGRRAQLSPSSAMRPGDR